MMQHRRPGAEHRLSGVRAAVILLVVTTLLGATGCAPPFPKDMLAKVDRGIAFPDLQKDPERFIGKWVMLAGVIVDVKNTKEGTVLAVLQKPADGQGRPEQTDASGGRFLVFTPEFLDAAVYQKGREFTVVGDVTGKKVQLLGEVEYTYPLVRARAVHLWEPSYTGPRFFFGVGVSKTL